MTTCVLPLEVSIGSPAEGRPRLAGRVVRRRLFFFWMNWRAVEMRRTTKWFCLALTLLCLGAATFQVTALVEPKNADEKAQGLDARAFQHDELKLPSGLTAVDRLPAATASRANRSLAEMGIDPRGARIDALGGRFETLLPSHPLLTARMAASETLEQRADSARQAFRSFLGTHKAQLGVDPTELAKGRVTIHGDGSVVQIYMERHIQGIPVEGSYVNGVINHGNLNLMGTHRWGDVEISTQPEISLEKARHIARAFVNPHQIDGAWEKDHLVLMPTVRDGQSYTHRLVWKLHPSFEGDLSSWQVRVDALSGEVLSLEDTNHYAEVKGGVYPVTNDGVVPDGVEQAGWPMPFATISTSGGNLTTDTGGNVAATGNMTSDLSGPFIRMNDNCGSISLTQSDGIDFGTSGGDDCVTPGFGGAGNTHSSRTGFYELNRIVEMARAQLPSNSWLQQQMTANMNINNTCNAFWNGSTVNFYRSGGGCANTGEIAGVFDHEWGHGMDDNDANPSIASPSGEGIADIYTALRLNDSCIGRNFQGSPCSGNGDPCLTCTGVRDIDYLQRQSGQPHDYSWSNANCGGSVHCVGGVYSEAVWSLWKRKLTAAPYNMNNNTAHELVTRLTFLGGGAVGTWFSGGPPFGGCSSSGGYLNFLAVDDDNGNINDGTPHMQAIYDAFNDQEIACNTPTVQDSGCANTPTAAPSLNTSAGNQQIGLSWNAVANASSYEVFRTEGVFACDFGKVKIAETAGTSFTDSGLQNGRDYSYVVIPKGSSDSCFGPASACATAQPVGQPDFTVSCSPASLNLQQGANGNTSCTVISSFGYTGSVNLSCSGNPSGIGCAFAPSSVSPPANGSANSTLTLSVDLAQATGGYSFDVVADDGSISRTSTVNVQVIPQGSNGPQTAVYDAGLGAPRCSVAGSECDSVGLLDGRANLGPESNQPNTLDTCTDGTSGSYHSDESNDRIVVSTLDGANLSEGATVEVSATVWAWSTGTSDTLDLYYAADANNPSWTLITSIVPPGGGQQTLTAQYTLPNGGLQAVRANFRYQGSQSPCSGGTYDDADDLVFAVETGGPTNTAPVVNITAPANGSSSTVGDSVAFSGTATDAEDGNIAASLSWSSSLDGSIGSGASFSTSGLSVGTHTITASVTDSGGLSDSDSISVTVDPSSQPVTVTFISIASEDGWTRESNENSNVGGASNANGAGARPIRPGDGTQDRQYKSILSFDTSSIPAGATIQSATLRLRRGTVRGSNPFTNGFGQCLVDVQSGGFSGNTALQASDFEAAATATAAASMTAPASNGDWSEGVLDASGRAAINDGGTTQFRVYFEVDDNDNGADDHMGYYSSNNSNSANHPQLVVTYLP